MGACRLFLRVIWVVPFTLDDVGARSAKWVLMDLTGFPTCLAVIDAVSVARLGWRCVEQGMIGSLLMNSDGKYFPRLPTVLAVDAKRW